MKGKVALEILNSRIKFKIREKENKHFNSRKTLQTE